MHIPRKPLATEAEWLTSATTTCGCTTFWCQLPWRAIVAEQLPPHNQGRSGFFICGDVSNTPVGHSAP
jgi:hypothetical protein